MYMSPSHAIFFEASHWPTGHMTRSQASPWRFTDVPSSRRAAYSLQPDVEQTTCFTLRSRKIPTYGPIRGTRAGSLEGWYKPPPSNDLQLC